jgi:DNA-binding MarR family transcriptional regulator
VPPAHGPDTELLTQQVDSALAASRVFMGVVMASIDGVESVVSIKQLRTLVLLSTHGPMNLASLAGRLEIHPSNATRMCDRLVEARLLKREQSDQDRRHLVLSLTPAGRRLVDKVMGQRRAALEKVLAAMPDDDRAQVARVLRSFAKAGGEVETGDPWAS